MSTFNQAGMREESFLRSYDWGAYALGFALSGFFDGILLHQVLQWHHLLSALEEGPFGDMRVQVMVDGLFHALMYLIAAVGLCLLVRARGDFRFEQAGRRLWANFWIGFGVWHIVDAVLSHWVTRIHRIRMDVPEPLVWDLAWLFLFGIIPLTIGLRMRARAKSRPNGPGASPAIAALLIMGVALAGALLNLYPMRGGQGDTITVILRPDASAVDLFASIEGTERRVLWHDQTGGIWVLAGGRGGDLLRFYQFGAMYVSGSVLPAGCSAWLAGAGTKARSSIYRG